MSLLTCRELCLGYEGTKVVEGLKFTVDTGDYLYVVGENGSGKSTLMKTILRLRSPLSGEIIMGEGLRQTEIGYLPQQTAAQRDFPASVREIVMSGCLNRSGNRPFYTREEKALALENMKKLGISELSGRCYRELSGGQQQRVLLARALCATKKLLLLDEPVAGLDPKAASDMYSVIGRLNREDGVTVIMISHDIEAAVKYASHILHIGHKPLFYGTAAEYIQSPVGKAFAGAGEERGRENEHA